MPTWGDPNGRGRRYAEAGAGVGGAAALGGGALAGRSARKQLFGTKAWNRRALGAAAGTVAGAGLIGVASHRPLSTIRSDLRKKRPRRERSGSRIDWASPPQGSVRTKNSSLGMQGALRASEEADARAKDFAGMATSASDALDRQKRVSGRMTGHVPERNKKRPKAVAQPDRSGWVMDDRVPGLIDRGWR